MVSRGVLSGGFRALKKCHFLKIFLWKPDGFPEMGRGIGPRAIADLRIMRVACGRVPGGRLRGRLRSGGRSAWGRSLNGRDFRSFLRREGTASTKGSYWHFDLLASRLVFGLQEGRICAIRGSWNRSTRTDVMDLRQERTLASPKCEIRGPVSRGFHFSGWKRRVSDGRSIGRKWLFPLPRQSTAMGPVVERYLAAHGLPSSLLYPDPATATTKLPPRFSDSAQKAYADYQERGPFKAFAVGPGGSWGYSTGRRTAKLADQEALGLCGPGCDIIARDGQ